MQALALGLSRNSLLLEASGDLRLSLTKSVSVVSLLAAPTVSKLTPVISKTMAPEHEREAPSLIQTELHLDTRKMSSQAVRDLQHVTRKGFDSRTAGLQQCKMGFVGSRKSLSSSTRTREKATMTV
jgi:hypothetical protein